MFQRTAQGIQGGGTFRIGDSTIVLGGRLARSDLGKLKRLLASAQQYYETAGYPAEALDQFDPGLPGNGGYDWQSKCPEYSYNDSAGWLDDFAKGASMVRDVANNPMVASTLAATGSWGGGPRRSERRAGGARRGQGRDRRQQGLGPTCRPDDPPGSPGAGGGKRAHGEDRQGSGGR
jgi:hypothetical protein